MKRASRRRPSIFYFLLFTFYLSGCQQDMAQQPRVKPLGASSFFADGRGSRQPVEGTVARGQLRDDEHLYTGKVNGELVRTFPFAVTREVLERGRQRFNIYCTPCHGFAGEGDGMIVRRGFKQPPSYHIERLQTAPAGHFFDVMSNGFGAMPDYAAQVAVEDRWAIVAYIRALQLSRNATLADVPRGEREKLERSVGTVK
ncbi:MAG: c-type cytochrome [Candidatus Acidiferrales bacterium]